MITVTILGISAIVLYYSIRLAVLMIKEIAMDYLWTEMPPVETFFKEPFNYSDYIFFRSEKDYNEYMEYKEHRNRVWWKE